MTKRRAGSNGDVDLPVLLLDAISICSKASCHFAEAASGQVRALLGAVRPDSVYHSVELPTIFSSLDVCGLDELDLLPWDGIRWAMQFHWLNNQGVRSDAGFELQQVDRFTMCYREPPNVLFLDSEIGLGHGANPAVLISAASLRDWDDGTPIMNQERERIIENIRLALEFQGINLVLDQVG